MVANSRLATAVLAVGFLSATTVHALDPAVKCESLKLKESSKYAACRLKAEAKAVKKGIAVDYTKCETKFAEKWAKTESKAGVGICPSEGDAATMDARITTDAAEIATLLAGGALPPAQQFPASGQTTPYGAGSDGDIQAGAALAYVDNGDGTILDVSTGLMWEKKDDSGGIHDKDNAYTWSTGTDDLDGTIMTTFLDTLNDAGGGGVSCFAGYCDWRAPNAKELASILEYEVFSPAVGSAFHQSATCTGCGDVTLEACSCTAASFHWSSTTTAALPSSALGASFSVGSVLSNAKTNTAHVRAVRGGS
jgi:hypothetical protein